MPTTRREMLGLISGSTFFLSASGSSMGRTGLPAGAPALTFPQGVASGDPRAEAVMLWTRAVPTTAGAAAKIPVSLAVSKSPDFGDIVMEATLETSADSDYTLRAYVDGLQADSHYFYRFSGADNSASRIGRTRTAPADHQGREVHLAFASCQNYENAFYGSWARMLADDEKAPQEKQIQFVLHLGDFIYERSWDRRSDGSPQSRTLPGFPDGERSEHYRHAVSLADYRLLYRTYLSDPHLQEARARWPFICTWDDHEFANDCFQSFSTYGDSPLLEPNRKQAANQAWFEYIPAVLDELSGQPAHDFRRQPLANDNNASNLAALDSLSIYRKLRWGKHLDIVLTDSRSYRSPPPVPEGLTSSLELPMNTVKLVEIMDAGSDYQGGNPPDTLPYGDQSTPNPARDRPPGTLLGSRQREWFLRSLESSDTQWKLWGNALPLIPMRLDMSSLPLTDYEDSIFNIDPWAGYPHELAELMNQLRNRGITGVVSLSGDHHMHGAGTVRGSASDPQARPACVDFTVAGISSSSLFSELLAVARREHPDFQPIVYTEQDGDIIPVWNMSMLHGVFAAYTYSKTGLGALANWLGPNRANPGLQYVDTAANGYGLATFSEDKLEVKMATVEACHTDFTEAPAIQHMATFQLAAWQADQEPELLGPEFDGGAPFPFTAPKV